MLRLGLVVFLAGVTGGQKETRSALGMVERTLTGHCCANCEEADSKDDGEAEFLALWEIEAEEDRDGKDCKEDIGNDVESGVEVGERKEVHASVRKVRGPDYRDWCANISRDLKMH